MNKHSLPVSWIEVGDGFPIVVCSAPAVPFDYWKKMLESLGDRYRFIFVHTRGLWGSHVPVDLTRVTVQDHARDLAFVVEELRLERYGMLGHCSGVTNIVASFSRLAKRPERVVLASTRFGLGASMGLEKILTRARSDARIRSQLVTVVTAYAPPALRAPLEKELGDMNVLEAQLRAIASVRAYAYDEPWPSDVEALLVRSMGDYDSIRETTSDYATRLGDRCLGVIDLEGGHCALLEDLDAARRVLSRAWS
jgi:pimeloyl-ACP methyl ester carboxylesterase